MSHNFPLNSNLEYVVDRFITKWEMSWL